MLECMCPANPSCSIAVVLVVSAPQVYIIDHSSQHSKAEVCGEGAEEIRAESLYSTGYVTVDTQGKQNSSKGGSCAYFILWVI